jgi:hypothetical protein
MKKLLVIAAMLMGLAIGANAQQNTNGIPQSAPLVKNGQTLNTQNQWGNQRGTGYGGLAVSDEHGRYFLAANNSHLFTLSTTAYTIVAANVYTDAIGTIVPIIGLYNPTGSGYLASIQNIHADMVSGTPGGPLMQLYYCGLNVTSKIASYNLANNYLSNTAGASVMIPQGGTGVLASSPASTATPLILGPLGGEPAVAAGVYFSQQFNIDGSIVVPPGCVYWLASYATGTSDVRNYSLTWEEVAQQYAN